jgi:hypothetical protein
MVSKLRGIHRNYKQNSTFPTIPFGQEVTRGQKKSDNCTDSAGEALTFSVQFKTDVLYK